MAKTQPLTKGQQIVSRFEWGMDLIEPAEIAQAIDDALEDEARKRVHMIVYAQQWEQLGRELITAWHGGDIQKASMYGLVVKAEGMLTNAPDD